MKLETLENRIGNIGKWNRKHWKMELRTLENEIWGHWKIVLIILENGIGNIGKWKWKHWKIKLETGLGIGFIGKWFQKH